MNGVTGSEVGFVSVINFTPAFSVAVSVPMTLSKVTDNGLAMVPVWATAIVPLIPRASVSVLPVTNVT